LLKPVDWEELRKAIAKARSYKKNQRKMTIEVQKLIDALNIPSALKQEQKEHFLGNARNSWVPVKVADVAYFTRDEINFMVTNSGERYVLDYDSLDEIESLLNPAQFYRASRHCIININAVQSVKGLANLKLQLVLKTPNQQFNIDISRDKAPSFKKWLEK
jgi:DNA-binding LytR/AlgR family response regulator